MASERGSDYKNLTMDFMKTRGLRPCFKDTVVRKNPKGELAALRLEFYCTAQSDTPGGPPIDRPVSVARVPFLSPRPHLNRAV